ncbi:MAG: TlpA disulfide reductase family protein [Planctomycetota bacterium]
MSTRLAWIFTTIAFVRLVLLSTSSLAAVVLLVPDVAAQNEKAIYESVNQAMAPGEDGYVWLGPKAGLWWCTLETPGGPLGFGLEVSHLGSNVFEAAIRNGVERIPVDLVSDSESQTFYIDLPHYNAVISGVCAGTGVIMVGDYVRTVDAETERILPFRAELNALNAYRPDAIDDAVSDPQGVLARALATPLAARWEIDFQDEQDIAVGQFRTLPDGLNVEGTILTTTGDYRHLAGRWDGVRLLLSTFDGAHAFLFDASLDGETLVGDFWSGDHYHTAFTATANPDAALPDPFDQTSFFDQPTWDALTFPNLDGEPTSLGGFVGKPMIVEIMGSWCPNCHDAAGELARLQAEFGDRIQTVAIAFEAIGDFETDAQQVRLYMERHGLADSGLEVLIGGLKDKDTATQALGFLDEVRAFPTTVFVNAQGKIEAVHTGFAGPAAAREHEEQAAAFTRLVRAMVENGG